MVHNFKDYPELPNSRMDEYFFTSPHKQITEDFRATVVKVHDGDTVTLSWTERDFDFPLRITDIDAPELNIKGGHRSRDALKTLIEGKQVQIIIDPDNRVEKWGRLLGDIVWNGLTISEHMISMGYATTFEDRRSDELPNIKKEFNIQKWLT